MFSIIKHQCVRLTVCCMRAFDLIACSHPFSQSSSLRAERVHLPTTTNKIIVIITIMIGNII